MDDGQLPDKKSSLSHHLRENIFFGLVGSEIPFQFPRVNRKTEGIGFRFSNTCQGFDNMRAECITKNLIPEQVLVGLGKASRQHVNLHFLTLFCV
jgi:hypothetical protein